MSLPEKGIGDAYQEAEIEANDDGVRYRNGGEFHITQVTGEGLGDDVHVEGGEAAEDGGSDNYP